MIAITKEEKELLKEKFPYEKFPRTMKQKSKRHKYFCVEREEMMRAIADTNAAAAEYIRQLETEDPYNGRRRWEKIMRR